MIFYAMRHGRTEYNDLGLIQGSKDVPLSLKGRKEVEAIRKKLQEMEFKTILVSPMMRAIETAQILFPNHELQLEPLLRERSFGTLEGQPQALLPKEIDSFSAIDLPYGIEPLVSVYQRAEAVTKKMEGMEEPILCITHGGILNMFHYLQYGIPEDNACIFQFRTNNELVEYHIGEENRYEDISSETRDH